MSPIRGLFLPHRLLGDSTLRMAITKVWIEDGCIVCNACETACPEVFHVTEDTCHIRGEVREDGSEDTNLDAKGALKADTGASLEDQIIEAAEGCPVEVIKFEKG